MLIRLTFVGFLLRRPVFGSCEAGDGEGVRGGKHWGYLLVEAGENSRFCFLFVCKLWFNNILIHLEWDRDVKPLQKLCKDVVKGVIAYVKVKKDATFPGPSPMDYTSLNSKENIYNSCFPDSSVYVYPKVTASFAYQSGKADSELHLGVAKQFFESFALRGETVANFYCGGGTGGAAAMMIGMNCVSVDIEDSQVVSCNMRITFRNTLQSLVNTRSDQSCEAEVGANEIGGGGWKSVGRGEEAGAVQEGCISVLRYGEKEGERWN